MAAKPDARITDEPPYGISITFIDHEELDEFADFVMEVADYGGEITFNLDLDKMYFVYPCSTETVAELWHRFQNRNT